MSVGIILTRRVVNCVSTKLSTALKLWMCQVNATANYKIITKKLNRDGNFLRVNDVSINSFASCMYI